MEEDAKGEMDFCPSQKFCVFFMKKLGQVKIMGKNWNAFSFRKKDTFMRVFPFGLYAYLMEDRFGLPADDNAIAENFFLVSRILLWHIVSGD